MLHTLWLIALFCITPAGVMWLCRRFPILNQLGPIMILYVVGLIIGNLPLMPAWLATVQEILPNVVIPLAIPMMLFGCRFSRHELGLQIKLVVSGFFSVAAAVVAGYLWMGHRLDFGDQVGGIISGMYTGGTLNAAALQAVFRIPSETFVLINSYDIVISFLYFIFLFSFGIKLFRRLYGQSMNGSSHEEHASTEQPTAIPDDPSTGWLLSRTGMKALWRTLCVTLLVVALSAATTQLFPPDWFMVVFILMLTTLGVACSFVKPVRTLPHSYDVGMYLIYIFSLSIASMADFSQLDLAGGIYQILFMSVAVFCSLFIHAALCRMMRVDADSMVITSVAFINSPPFVPMVSAAMRNKNTLVMGLGAGIVGYALGNHFGVLMAELLSHL